METMITAIIESFKELSKKCYVLFIYVKEKVLSLIEAIRNSIIKRKIKKLS